MANIKWTGIEQKKYGLTARWYVSAFYGNDNDVDEVGLYDSDSNDTGHGGPTRPFATLSKVDQEGSNSDVVVLDSAYYSYDVSEWSTWAMAIVGDGFVIVDTGKGREFNLYNLKIIGGEITARTGYGASLYDCFLIYTTSIGNSVICNNSIFYSCVFEPGYNNRNHLLTNCNLINCSGTISFNKGETNVNNHFLNCESLTFEIESIKPTLMVLDYSILIGGVKTSTEINGKTTGVTIEDFKEDGNYFVKSYSEVDLFGNNSGEGATIDQINEIFNNYYSPIYMDDWQNADFTLRPNADDRVKFGGLNGTYIGAKPVGYRFSASDLWNTHVDSANTSNLDYDLINDAIVLASGQDVGTYRSVRISLPEPITVDLVEFFANFVYNVEGTAKQGVANQRIDTTTDLEPDNTENQRVVYDYRLQVAPNNTDDLSVFKDYELNREPTVDGDGNSQLNDLFDDDTEQKQTVQDFIIEFTLRRVIID